MAIINLFSQYELENLEKEVAELQERLRERRAVLEELRSVVRSSMEQYIHAIQTGDVVWTGTSAGRILEHMFKM